MSFFNSALDSVKYAVQNPGQFFSPEPVTEWNLETLKQRSDLEKTAGIASTTFKILACAAGAAAVFAFNFTVLPVTIALGVTCLALMALAIFSSVMQSRQLSSMDLGGIDDEKRRGIARTILSQIIKEDEPIEKLKELEELMKIGGEISNVGYPIQVFEPEEEGKRANVVIFAPENEQEIIDLFVGVNDKGFDFQIRGLDTHAEFQKNQHKIALEAFVTAHASLQEKLGAAPEAERREAVEALHGSLMKTFPHCGLQLSQAEGNRLEVRYPAGKTFDEAFLQRLEEKIPEGGELELYDFKTGGMQTLYQSEKVIVQSAEAQPTPPVSEEAPEQEQPAPEPSGAALESGQPASPQSTLD